MELGRLERMQPRLVWANEAHDFTPWLLANGDRLAEALGLELELHVAEHPVGGFSLDLMGRDLSNDTVVIVENQLEGTDHTHLGQIMTYAAGTDASTIVWVATSFREEHRQAIDWLNEKTADDVNFFGVQVSVVRIGDSAPAPLFDIVAKPNSWQKQVRTSARATEPGSKAEAYRRFWTKYLDRQRELHPNWGRRMTPQPANWMGFQSGVRGVQIVPSFATAGGKRLRHELYIDTTDADTNTALFETALARREDIETSYGGSLDFDPIPNKRACRIADHLPGEIAEESRWDEFVEWFIHSGEGLRRALAVSGLVQG